MLAIFPIVVCLLLSVSSTQKQVYIVYLGEHSGAKSFQEIEHLHHSYLHFVKGSNEEAKACIIYSYKNAINGFSALLTLKEASTISEMDGVISVFHSHPRKYGPHTTRSWDFISLLEADWDPSKSNGEEVLRKASYGKNVIVGVLDTGVWPESESFNDDGMEPIPASWKGVCQTGVSFNSSHCNRKLVGARYYLRSYEMNYGRLDPRQDFRSPRDMNGHGTHTSSTVGGRSVGNVAAVGGFGLGTASGGATLARLATYKVCWPIPEKAGVFTCLDDDMLAAFDDAIADGVQVLSVSIGGSTSLPYTQDGIAIGALHAARKSIVVACSAGNSGPLPSTVTNVAPWIITVGASSIDRIFASPVELGNGFVAKGQSIAPFEKGTYPLVYAASVEIPGTTTNRTLGLCRRGTLSPSLVRGKAVFCWRGETFQALEVQRAGGVAAVLGNIVAGIGVVDRSYLIPATVVLSNETMMIYNYTVTAAAPTATLIPTETVIGTKPAPFMAVFTSRGPNLIQPNILKPDITAPGLNILAAWSEASSPLNLPSDPRVVKFQIISGTSMSCPHVAAAASLLKAIHPDWSSAAIRSALMTTASITNNLGNPITDAVGNPASPFEYGAGHIQPSKAADPGLVYDASYTDYYLHFICNSSTSNSLDPSFNCPVNHSPSNLNYPSLAIADLKGSRTVMRTVTNVGIANSSYSVTVNPPPGYSVRISPARLDFRATGEEQSFNITIQVESSATKHAYAFGSYSWSDGIHLVRSPIQVSTTNSPLNSRLLKMFLLQFLSFSIFLM